MKCKTVYNVIGARYFANKVSEVNGKHLNLCPKWLPLAVTLCMQTFNCPLVIQCVHETMTYLYHNLACL